MLVFFRTRLEKSLIKQKSSAKWDSDFKIDSEKKDSGTDVFL